MSAQARVFFVFTVIAFAVAAFRFVPTLAIPRGVADFAAGLGVGLLIGVIVTWSVERGAP